MVEQASGGVALFIQGSAGDVDPVVYRDRGRHAGNFEVAANMGIRLAEAVAGALPDTASERRPDLRVATRRIEVPLDPPPPLDELIQLRAALRSQRGPVDVLPTNNQARWAMFELAWADDLIAAMQRDAVPRALPVEVTAARIGELLVVACPFELYSQIGLDIRRELAPRHVLIAGYSNGLLSYLPTDRAKDQGGYGPASSYRFFPAMLTPTGRGADATVVRAAVNLLRAL
jgi:hypothetical protein